MLVRLTSKKEHSNKIINERQDTISDARGVKKILRLLCTITHQQIEQPKRKE